MIKEFAMHLIHAWKVKKTGTKIKLVRLALEDSSLTLNRITHQLPWGAYTTFRTYGENKILPLSYQVKRLEQTSLLAEQPIIIDECNFRAALRSTINVFPKPNTKRIRVVIDLEANLGDMYIIIEEFRTLPSEVYKFGVDLITCQVSRENPQAKLTGFIRKSDRFRTDMPADIHEALMINEEGFILEGLTSNFFAIKKGVIWTADDVVLSGITRQIVISEAVENQIEINYQPISNNDLSDIEGAFLTSASRGVLPIRSIDNNLINDGILDSLLIRIMSLYSIHINSELESI